MIMLLKEYQNTYICDGIKLNSILCEENTIYAELHIKLSDLTNPIVYKYELFDIDNITNIEDELHKSVEFLCECLQCAYQVTIYVALIRMLSVIGLPVGRWKFDG